METISPYQSNVEILEDVYYEISEFMKFFAPVFGQGLIGKKRQRPFSRLSIEEIMTILVTYQIIGGQNFKQFDKDVILQFHKGEFPNWVSYEHFVNLAPIAITPLTAFLKFRMEMSQSTQIYVVDSTPLRVCENIRIPRHRTFVELAKRGKTSMGWFYGFKLHLVINHLGQLMAVHISAGNLDDRKALKKMMAKLKGKIFADKGYISQPLFEELFEQGLELITTLKKNMKAKYRSTFDKILLRKRAVIESVNDLIKNFFQIEHSRHRSVVGFMLNTLAALVAYSFYPKKPHMRNVELDKGLQIILMDE